jgi:hypothetical protein
MNHEPEAKCMFLNRPPFCSGRPIAMDPFCENRDSILATQHPDVSRIRDEVVPTDESEESQARRDPNSD